MPDTVDPTPMNGAESLVRTLVAAGVDTCFANPGTSEMHFVAALDRVPGIRCVLGLFEGVVSGAADGYARMTDRPAATLLHLGPGLGNALANLHNARKARSPIVNIVGDHATHHRRFDAPLTSDVEGVARPMSHWVKTSDDARLIAADGALAVAEARSGAGRIATLILPADTAWNPSDGPAAPVPVPPKARVDEAAVAEAARILRDSGASTLIVIAGKGLRTGILEQAGRIARKTGAVLLAPTSNARMERGAGRVPVRRILYDVDGALAQLAPFRQAIILGADEPPVAFFAYPGKPSLTLPPDCTVHRLAGTDDDLADAIDRLAEAVGAAAAPPPLQAAHRPELPRGDITPETIAQAVAALFPENAIIVDEGISCSRALYATTAGAPAHDWLALTGGSIGIGMPLATGAAVACPDRKVINFQADGSGLYTLQALWTQAREGLDVLTVVFVNNAYASLDVELAKVGALDPGQRARDMLELDRPAIDWVALASGFGVEAARADTLERLIDLLRAGLARKGPMLIAVPCLA